MLRVYSMPPARRQEELNYLLLQVKCPTCNYVLTWKHKDNEDMTIDRVCNAVYIKCPVCQEIHIFKKSIVDGMLYDCIAFAWMY